MEELFKLFCDFVSSSLSLLGLTGLEADFKETDHEIRCKRWLTDRETMPANYQQLSGFDRKIHMEALSVHGPNQQKLVHLCKERVRDQFEEVCFMSVFVKLVNIDSQLG